FASDLVELPLYYCKLVHWNNVYVPKGQNHTIKTPLKRQSPRFSHFKFRKTEHAPLVFCALVAHCLPL
ncbi:MAG TPA: hypothetical protein H9840_03940, partial [Candidatus Anaerofilum excrementigallinarum]|nr:hypothetical protein [Candidatus Anaerofilum excrementigallinarum]